MTTAINDIIDFIRIIRERPEWADAARSVLLSQELLELPQRLAEYAVATNQRMERLETTLADFMVATNQRLEQLESTLAAFVATTNRRLTALEVGQDELKVGQDELKASHDKLKAGQDELKASHDELKASHDELKASHDELKSIVTTHGIKLDRLEAGQNDIRRSIGPLRGFLALNGALRATRRIARIMNCRQVRLLNDDELHDMLRANDTADISPSDQISFENADIAIVAEHRNTGEIHYIAVETSFTAHEDDTRRAIRNARYLSRFTGQPAHAVVVSVFASPEVQHIFTSGQVYWYEIERRYLEPD